MDERPMLNRDIAPNDFTEFYWLKEELVKFCKQEGLITTGGKIDVANRIELFLKTGEIQQTKSTSNIRIKVKSKFDWNHENLSLDTVITDSYKNSQNVRSFFIGQLGSQFKFNVQFMDWMKLNQGMTLRDATQEWERIKVKKKSNTKHKEMAPQFEYNRYLRDFMVDNPTLDRAIGIRLWKIKKSLRGSNIYESEDLKMVVN